MSHHGKVGELLVLYEEMTGLGKRDVVLIAHPDDLPALLSSVIRTRERFMLVPPDNAPPLQQGAAMELYGVPVYTSRFAERGKVRVRPADLFRMPTLKPYIEIAPQTFADVVAWREANE